MNSHRYAEKLKQLAEFLLSKPAFEMPWGEQHAYTYLMYFGDKSNFLGAVKALGNVRKEWKKDELWVTPKGTDMLQLSVSRSAVCRKVQEEKWECEPLLSPDEEAEIGGVAE